MSRMRSHRFTTRCTTWVFALALLLKAAVPMLAATAAQWQGKALAEVCTVYGVATVTTDSDERFPGHESGAAHATDHCALSGWVALSTPTLPAAALPGHEATEPVLRPAASTEQLDACAAWVAQIQHGPPRGA